MLTLKFFGSLKDLLGRAEERFPWAGPATVAEILDAHPDAFGVVRDLVRSGKVLVSVNQEIAHESTIVKDGDEVAFLPPFAGGGNDGWVRIQREDFSVDEEIARLKTCSRRIGGIGVFIGVARDFSKGKPVERITFEHYPQMAEKTLNDLRIRAIQRFNILGMAIIHRIGEISIGDNIVLVAAAGEHREEAFSACRWAIEELKAVTPIWKRERTPDGEVWVEEHP